MCAVGSKSGIDRSLKYLSDGFVRGFLPIISSRFMRNLHVFKELFQFLSKTHTKCLGCRTGHRLGVGTQTFAIFDTKCARITCIGGCRSKSEMPILKMFTDAVLAAHWDLRAHTLPCWGLFAPPNMFVHLTSWEYNGGGIFTFPVFEILKVESFRHIVGGSQQNLTWKRLVASKWAGNEQFATKSALKVR